MKSEDDSIPRESVKFIGDFEALLFQYAADAHKFYSKSNNTAGVRARKVLSEMINLCKHVRSDIQHVKHQTNSDS